VSLHDDLALARSGAAQDAAALAEIVRRHQTGVRTFLRRLCGNAARADDLAQDVFLTAFDRLASYRGDASLAAWLCGIAYRKFRSDQRSAARQRMRELAVRPETVAEGAAEARLDIQMAFAGLPVDQRAAAALCLLADMPHAEAATALQIPLGTLKSRVAAAKKTLSETLKAYR
jgi:RNA polymerase sigma-70 factor (ECF subfamily)